MNRNYLHRIFLALGVCITLSAALPASSEPLNVRFSWKIKGEYVPFFVAKDDGNFSRHKLEVNLGEGAGAQAVLAGLLQGNDDIAIVPAPFAMTAISKGMPIKIIALYQPLAPLSIVSLSDKPVRVPKDLEGKMIGVSVGDTVADYLDVFCKKNSVDCTKIQRVIMDPQIRLSQFLTQKVDVLSSYSTVDTPLIEEKLPANKLVSMDVTRYGLVLPGMAVVVKDSDITARASVLRSFLAAVSEGIDESRADIPAATGIMRKNWTASPSENVVRKQVEATLLSIPPAKQHASGWVDDALIAQALTLLQTNGQIPTTKPPSAYYNNDLLK
jgi:NitT/TauT family transport system substrate-binding protein